MVELQVLGTFGVLIDGVPQRLRSEKQRLILAHLALAGDNPVSEHVLVDELWTSAPADPLHALQAHVSRLRQATSLTIEYTDGGYRLDRQDVTLDATRFEELLREAERVEREPESVVRIMQGALALWRGEVLESLPLTHLLLAQRARLDLLREQAVTDLVDAQLAVGQPEDALPLLHRAVELNPLDERRWAQLMTALQRTGQRGEALEVFARARTQLIAHLGLEPNARLQQLQQEILRDDGPRVGPGSRPGDLDPPADVVGRDREWSVLMRLWQEAQSEQRVAVITGEPGIGKTHLASRFVAALPDTPLHSGRCHAGQEIPYQPVSQLIRSDSLGLTTHDLDQRFGADPTVLRQLVPDVLAAILDPQPTSGGPLDPQVEQHRIQLGMIEWLRQSTRSGAICLVIDDLQWADPDSLRLLAQLWSQPLQVPVLWVVTARQHEMSAGSTEGELFEQATRPSASVRHLPLEGLSRPAVADLMQSALGEGPGAPLPAQALDEMLAATAGNPLLVLETTRHLLAHDGVAGGLTARPVPRSLATIVDVLLAQLDPPARELLDVAAIIGEDFDPLLVGLATDRGPRELDEFLVLAQHLRLLSPLSSNQSRLRFRHSLVHAVVLQQISPMRRAELHLHVAHAVGDHPHLHDRLHLLAHHQVRAVSLVGADAAIGHLLAAAQASLEQGAPAVALHLYEQARDLVTSESDPSKRCEIHLGLGVAGFRAGVDYRDELLVAAGLADQIGDVDLLVRAAVANNRGWYSSITEVDRSRISVIEAALAKLAGETDPRHQASRSRLLSLWAMENVRDPSRRKEVLLKSRESMELADDLADPDLLGEIMCHRFSVLYATLADPISTFEFAKRLDDFAHSRIDPELQLNSAIAVAQVAMTVGDFAAADPALERSELLAAQLSHPARMWLVATWVATRTAMRGDLDGAHAKAATALDMGMACEQPDAFIWFAGQTLAFHHVAGRLGELIDVVEEQATSQEDQIPAWRAAFALTLVTVGRHEEAQAIVDTLHERGFEDLPKDVLYLPAMSYLAETVTHLQDVGAAQTLYDALLPYKGMTANNATLDAGPIDLQLGRLASLIGADATAQHHLRAAAALCRRAGAVLWLDQVEKAQAGLA